MLRGIIAESYSYLSTASECTTSSVDKPVSDGTFPNSYLHDYSDFTTE